MKKFKGTIIKKSKSLLVEKGKPMEEQKSLAERVRDMFRTTGSVVLKDAAEQLYGDTTPKTLGRTKSIVYAVTRSIEIELKKTMVWHGDRWEMEETKEEPRVTLTPDEAPQKTSTASRSKTAVLVIKEVRQNGEARYELDVVGDFSRGMIKEALKQLMEVYI